MSKCSQFSCLFLLATGCLVARAQPPGFNYDESKVPKYLLPDPLTTAGGAKVEDAATWYKTRRPEILELFRREVYGRSPTPRKDMTWEVLSANKEALSGTAIRKQVRVYFSADKQGPYMDLLIYLPHSKKPVPAFMGLNFSGNHSIHSDPQILLSQSWMRPNDKKGIVRNRATPSARGTSASRWAVEKILSRGFGLVTIYYGDIDPDYHDEFQNGVHPLFYENGQHKPKPDEWGSIAAWAWGLSRALDYLETDEQVDHKHVAVLGHSRLGKTALWAGAEDQRFALVISNDSGCGGAALSRRRFGETVKRINTSFPHWFNDRFNAYNDNEDDLPVDQHMLISLIAPRPVYIASAEQDRWADPQGEFLSACHADAVYRLLGTGGLGDAGRKIFQSARSPTVDEPLADTIGYHIRAGKHDVTDFDWDCYLDFAEKHFSSSK